MKLKLFTPLIFLFFFNLTEVLLAQLNNNIVLKVENEIITSYEIKNKILITLITSGKEINQKNINDFKESALASLIQLKLKRIELSKYNFNTTDFEVENYIQKTLSNNIVSFKEKLKANNLSLNLFLEEVKIELAWKKLIFQLYSKKINIDEKDIDKKINEIIKNQEDLIEYKISEIEIILENNELDETRLLNVNKQIEKEGFENIAIKLSISSSASNKGNLGWVNAKSLSTRIYKAINKLEVGEISKPIRNQNSALILKLVEKRFSKAENLDTSKLKENMINKKKNELFNLYSRSRLSKLKNTSLIEFK